MASGRYAGQYRIFIESPSGTRKQVASANSNWFNVSGLGSPDGVISTTATPEKQNYLPLSADRGSAGYSIVLEVEGTTTDGIDASDCVMLLPVEVNGHQEIIGLAGGNGINSNNFTADLAASDITATAGVSQTIMKIRAREGVHSFAVGGGKVFLSLENDTA
jgi:hypothetical protein